MLRTLLLATALTLAGTSASAQSIDDKGNCHDANGKLVATGVCKRAGAPVASGHRCKRGKPCRKNCIAMDKVCRLK